MIRHALRCLACFVALAASASSQAIIYELHGLRPSQHLGNAAIGLGDINADGYGDFAASGSTGNPNALWETLVFSGRNGAILAAPGPIGLPFARAGDLDLDGVMDIFVQDGATLQVWSMATMSPLLTIPFSVPATSASAAGFIDADSIPDIVVGYGWNGNAARVFSGANGALLFTIGGQCCPSEAMGQSVCGLGDISSDGIGDIAVGAPYGYNSSGKGNFQVVSGQNGGVLSFEPSPLGADFGMWMARLGDITQDGVPDLAVSGGGAVGIFSGQDASLVRPLAAPGSPNGFGTSLANPGDPNMDGFPDVLVGAPGDNTYFQYGGSAWLFSGQDGSVLGVLAGNSASDFLGTAVDGIGDANGDGFDDYIVSAPSDDFGLQDNGTIYVVSGSPCPPISYCTAKLSSLGCRPEAGATGLPSLTGADNLYVTARSVLSNKNGLMFWGRGANAAPFAGGTLCVQSPLKRTGAQSSGGNTPTDCSGTLTFHFSQAYMQSVGLHVGATVYCQYWYRDPGYQPPASIGLTDAVRFTICP